jgi:hypothetical protein
VFAERQPGFESLPIRHVSDVLVLRSFAATYHRATERAIHLLRVNGPPRQHLEILTQLYHAGIR